MRPQRDAAIDEIITDAAPNLPSPYGPAAPERPAPDRVGEVPVAIFVHQLNSRTSRQQEISDRSPDTMG